MGVVYNSGRQDLPQMKILILLKSDCSSALAWILVFRK